MSKTLDVGKDGKKRLDVDSSRGKKGLANSGRLVPRSGISVAETGVRDDTTSKRETVGVDSSRSKTKENIILGHVILSRELGISSDGTDSAAGSIVIILLIHARHLSSLSANQSTAGLTTSIGNTLDEISGGRKIQFAAAIVVKEHDRSGTLNNKIVDVHSDQINTNRVVLLHGLGNHKLSTDTINSTDDDRGLRVAGLGQINLTTKTTNLGISTRSLSASDGLLDLLDEVVAGLNVDTSLGVSHGGLSSRTEGTVGNILSVESALKLNSLVVKSSVGGINGSSERVANGVDSDNATTGGLETSAVECGTGMEDVASGRRSLNSHSLALRIRTGVATGSKNNSSAELVVNGQLAVVKVSIGTGKHDLSQISIGRDERKDSLCLGVTKSDVVLEDLGALAGDHEASEENTTERLLLSSHTGDSGLKNLTVNELSKLLGSNVCRRIAAHATSVGTLVSIEDALVVLSEGERSDSVAIAEGKNAELVTN